MNAIELVDLTKRYGKNRGIQNVTMAVERGEFFGFIGPNGAGKSTTIRLLLGLIRPTSGSGEVLGQPIGNPAAYLPKVGYLPSEVQFYRGMRVREIIRLSARLRKADCANEAARLCETLSLDTGKRVEELSLGNRKKLAIVCALQHRPDLYILDEPTSGLDPLVQRDFFRLLEQRNAEGATVFFSSHVLGEVQRHCTRMAIVREGELTAQGSVKELAATSARHVVVHGMQQAPVGLDAQCLHDVHAVGNAVDFLYTGSLPDLARCLAQANCEDFTVEEPDLERTFMSYYESEADR